MNTAPLESSFRLQGTPRTGYINILMKTDCGKGFWHISTGCKELFYRLPCAEPHLPPPPPSARTAGETPWGDGEEQPAGFYGPSTHKGTQSPQHSGDKGQRMELQLLAEAVG